MERESENDRQKENLFKIKIEQQFDRRLFKLPADWRLDFIVAQRSPQGKLWTTTGFCELKCRNFKMDKYKTTFMPLSKFQAAKELCHFTGNIITGQNCRFTLFIQFLDASTFASFPYDIDTDQFEGSFIKPKNNDGEEEKEEYVLHIPLSLFRVFLMRFIDCIDDIMLEMEGEEFAELAAIWGKDLDPFDPIKIVHMPEDNLEIGRAHV